ncbi:MAG: (d)CMP kinase [Fibrobacter sp.]|jgi:cytidylate kinase|nr:(d)CMP kinase [Fibrobacter sp.]
MIIAIDGPAGSGKSTTAKIVASRLGITYLDTGAMYRVITLKALRAGIPATDEPALARLTADTVISFSGKLPDTRVFMDGEDVTDAIRGSDVTSNVSDYCAPKVVREALVEQQRRIAEGNSVVCEGRDIGTVVFPNADLKFFMTASVVERAKRRQKDFEKLGISKSVDELVEEITLRDKKDSTRANSPLCKADDALEIDTTSMSLEEQAELIIERALRLMKEEQKK